MMRPVSSERVYVSLAILQGVGPVTSMELLAEFPGGLSDLKKFYKWFQSIKDPSKV
jgi:hypothetical protein